MSAQSRGHATRPVRHAGKPDSLYANDRASYHDLTDLLTRAWPNARGERPPLTETIRRSESRGEIPAVRTAQRSGGSLERFC